MNKHPFRRELNSKPVPSNLNLHVATWTATVAVDQPRVHIAILDGEVEVMVTAGGIPLPYNVPVWAGRAGASVPVVPISPGQLVEITARKPFTAVLDGFCASLPGNLPAGTWVSFPNRAVSCTPSYFRVRRVAGLADTQVVTPDGQPIEVDAQGTLAAPVLLAPNNVLRRVGTPLDAPETVPLMLVGDLIAPAHEVWAPDNLLRDARVLIVAEDGDEVEVHGAQATEAIQAARATV